MKELQAALRNLDLAIKLLQLETKEPEIKAAAKVLILEAEEALLAAKKIVIGGGDDEKNTGS